MEGRTRSALNETHPRRIFGILFFSIFATITGVGIVAPLLPVYAHDLGAGGFYISLIFASFSISRTVFLPYFGRLSDRKGRKPFIVAGLLGYALISGAFILSQSVEALIAIRFIQGIASAMIMPVTQAYIGEITPPGKEGFSMGMFNVSTFLGLSIGPLIGGALNDYFSMSAAFGCLGVMAMIGFLLSATLLPPRSSEKTVLRPTQSAAWTSLLHDRGIAGIVALRFAYTACIGLIWCFLPVLAASVFQLGSFKIGILVTLGVFASGVLSMPMGYVADRVHKIRMAVLGGVIITGAVYSFVWADGFRGLFVSNLLFGIGGGIAMPPIMAIAVNKGNAKESMGSVMALMTMAHSLGMLSGALLGGIIMDLGAIQNAFPIGAGLMAFNLILFYACARGDSSIDAWRRGSNSPPSP